MHLRWRDGSLIGEPAHLLLQAPEFRGLCALCLMLDACLVGFVQTVLRAVLSHHWQGTYSKYTMYTARDVETRFVPYIPFRREQHCGGSGEVDPVDLNPPYGKATYSISSMVEHAHSCHLQKNLLIKTQGIERPVHIDSQRLLRTLGHPRSTGVNPGPAVKGAPEDPSVLGPKGTGPEC